MKSVVVFSVNQYLRVIAKRNNQLSNSRVSRLQASIDVIHIYELNKNAAYILWFLLLCPILTTWRWIYSRVWGFVVICFSAWQYIFGGVIHRLSENLRDVLAWSHLVVTLIIHRSYLNHHYPIMWRGANIDREYFQVSGKIIDPFWWVYKGRMSLQRLVLLVNDYINVNYRWLLKPRNNNTTRNYKALPPAE